MTRGPQVLQDPAPARPSSQSCSSQWPPAPHSSASLNPQSPNTKFPLALPKFVHDVFTLFNRYSFCYCVNHGPGRKEKAYWKGRLKEKFKEGAT